MPREYTAINLPAKTIAKLRRLKIALALSSGEVPSYSEVVDTLFDSLEKSNPGLYNTYLNITDTSVDSL